MTLVECRESLKGIANFIAQDACFGDEDMLQVQQLANKLSAWKRSGAYMMIYRGRRTIALKQQMCLYKE